MSPLEAAVFVALRGEFARGSKKPNFVEMAHAWNMLVTQSLDAGLKLPLYLKRADHLKSYEEAMVARMNQRDAKLMFDSWQMPATYSLRAA